MLAPDYLGTRWLQWIEHRSSTLDVLPAQLMSTLLRLMIELLVKAGVATSSMYIFLASFNKPGFAELFVVLLSYEPR